METGTLELLGYGIVAVWATFILGCFVVGYWW